MGAKRKVYVIYLVAAAQAGDRLAISALAEHWYPVLKSHAFRLLGNLDQAEDSAQTAWIEIQRGLLKLRDTEAFPAWSLRIVSRTCAKLIRQVQTKRSAEGALVPGHESEQLASLAEPTTSPVGEEKVLAAQVRAAIERLSPTHRATLALFYLQDMGVAELAIAMDVPVGTVKSRLSAARAALKSMLIKE